MNPGLATPLARAHSATMGIVSGTNLDLDKLINLDKLHNVFLTFPCG